MLSRCRLNNILKSNWLREEIKPEIKRHIEINENENTKVKFLRHRESDNKRKVYVRTGLSQKQQKKSQIKNPTFYRKELEKEERTKPTVSSRKGIIKNRAELKETENKKTIENSAIAGSLRRSIKLTKP